MMQHSRHRVETPGSFLEAGCVRVLPATAAPMPGRVAGQERRFDVQREAKAAFATRAHQPKKLSMPPQDGRNVETQQPTREGAQCVPSSNLWCCAGICG